MENIQVFSPKGIKDNFKLKGILAKKVIADNGEIIGKVKDIAFDLNKVIGIYVAGPFGLGNILIDKDYIDQMLGDSIVLKINPLTSIIGKLVFDKDGKKLGKVKEIVRNNQANDFKEIIVRKNIFTKPFYIPKKDMDVIDKNIILNRIM